MKKKQNRKIFFPFLAVLLLFLILINCGKDKSKEGTKDVHIEWVKVEGGSFQMGFHGGVSNEKPVHTVYLDTYYISKYEVTFSQYDKFCESTGRSKPSDQGWGRKSRPVINVSWYDAVAFCKWLSKKTDMNIHLPTEAQWEYAARGGNKSKGYKYSGSNDFDSVAWCWKNSGDDKLSGKWRFDRLIKNNCRTHPVGRKQSNELGIHDMSGNVWEWCSDWYGYKYYSSSPRNNPTGPSSGSSRVCRGGCWGYNGRSVQSVYRSSDPPLTCSLNLGFRPCLSQIKQKPEKTKNSPFP